MSPSTSPANGSVDSTLRPPATSPPSTMGTQASATTDGAAVRYSAEVAVSTRWGRPVRTVAAMIPLASGNPSSTCQ